MKNRLLFIIYVLFVSNTCISQTTIDSLDIYGKWEEKVNYFIDRRDTIIEKRYLEYSFLEENLSGGNSLVNINRCEINFINDSLIIDYLFYDIKHIPTSIDTLKYRFVNKKTIEYKIENKKPKNIKVHLLYLSKQYLIMGYEEEDIIILYKKKDVEEIDEILNIKDEYCIVPFVEKYIKQLGLNIKIIDE